MLPKIFDIAEEQGLTFNPRTLRHKEVYCKCPFCKEDTRPGKEKKFYLSLNTEDQVFRCWFCGERGGVLYFEAKLTGVSYEEVKEKRFGKLRKPIHAAERLSPSQLARAGWKGSKKKNKTVFKKNRDQILKSWLEYEFTEMVGLYAEFLVISALQDAERKHERHACLKKRCEKTSIQHCYNRLMAEYQESTGAKWATEGKRLAEMAWKTCQLQQDTDLKEIVVYVPFFHYMWKVEREQKKVVTAQQNNRLCQSLN
ncbi:hypothetical protein [Pseudobacillus badius]|uniref:hypothetical protein n=1 Tax=Bacillus badius TaxID=1455 RepID=UPI001CBAB0A2|nr:hypothetical protein [Bacillus badius]UAT32398.1 hypothetical protein K7T73_09395 [Bacillus badius]GLY12871.1 hypothetical protein Bbad01_40870 [Bacillus badius]